MGDGGLYQIRSKEEEHVFRVFFFLSIFLEGNLERACRGFKERSYFLDLERRILLLLKNIFSRL